MEKRKIRFLTLFPKCKNVHLVKDVGMIPFSLYSICGYDASLACYDTDLEFIHSEVAGLKLKKIDNKTNNIILDGCIFLWKNAKSIDVLQFYYGGSKSNIFWQFIYKIRNPKGITYLKLDEDICILERFDFNRKGIKGALFRRYLRRCDIISAEIKEAAEKIGKAWKLKIEYIPNGFYKKSGSEHVRYEEKQDLICTAGRLGTLPKNTEELLEGFALFANKNKKWDLLLIGSLEGSFRSYVAEYFNRYPDLKDRIEFSGYITERDELNALYARSKIFALTSRWENFSLVYLEALSNGCYIVTSKVGAYKDVTNNGEYGCWYTSGDPEQFAMRLEECCTNEEKLKEKCEAMQDFVYKEFYWPEIAAKLDIIIKRGLK